MKRHGRLLTLVLIFAASLALRWRILSGVDLLPGPDGGYYAAGVRDVLAGRPPWGGSEPPLFFLLAAVPSSFLGVFAGTRVAAALASSCMAFSGYLLSAELLGPGWVAVGAAAALTFAGPYLSMMMDFYKNCLALAILPLWLWAHLGLREDRRKIAWLLVAGLGLASSHLAVFAFAVLLSAMAEVLDLGWRWGRGDPPRASRFARWGVVVAATLLAAFFLVPPLRETALRYWEAVSFSPQATRWQLFSSPGPLTRHYAGLGLAATAGLVAAFPWPDRRLRFLVAWTGAGLVLAQPPVHLAERFALMLFPLVILWAAHFLGHLARLGQPRLVGLACLLVVVALALPLDRAVVTSRGWRPVVDPRELPVLASAAAVIGPGETVLARHDGTQYWFTYASGVPTLSRGAAELAAELDRRLARGERPLLFVQGDPPPPYPHRVVWSAGRFRVVRVLGPAKKPPSKPPHPGPGPGDPPGHKASDLVWAAALRAAFLPAYLTGLLPVSGPLRYVGYLGAGLALTALAWGLASGWASRRRRTAPGAAPPAW